MLVWKLNPSVSLVAPMKDIEALKMPDRTRGTSALCQLSLFIYF